MENLKRNIYEIDSENDLGYPDYERVTHTVCAQDRAEAERKVNKILQEERCGDYRVEHVTVLFRDVLIPADQVTDCPPPPDEILAETP